MSEATSAPCLLRTERLSKTYPDRQVHALDDVSFAVRRGEWSAIMGPSGCGKSTLLNLLGALDRPTGGEVYFDSEPLSRISDVDRFRSQRIGFVFQSFFLLPTLTARENVQVPMFEGALSASQRAARARELIEAVGMSHRADRWPMQLSVGERQRIAIARALANEPALLLADESTGNLDSRTSTEILDLFRRLHTEQGLTLVMVTHSEQVAEAAQRLIRMRDGRIVSDSGAGGQCSVNDGN